MHRRSLLASSLIAATLGGCHRRLRTEARRMRWVTARASAEGTAHEVRLADDRTRGLVKEQLAAISPEALSSALLRGIGSGGRPYLPFDFWNDGVTSPSDGELKAVLKSIRVSERGGFVDLDVAAHVTLTSVHAGVIHELDQEAHSRGGLDLRTASHGIWLASAAKPLPVFNDLSREITGLSHWIGERAIRRLQEDLG